MQAIKNSLSKEDLLQLQKWIVCVAVVKFDIDEGQIIDQIIPENALTIQEQRNLSLLSFPDSNSITDPEGFLRYIFRIKRDISSPYRFSFGFSLFQQKKDPQIQRGYSQKSFVLLTNNSFLSFFNQITNLAGKIFFANQQNPDFTLQQLIASILSWPSPENSKAFNVELFNQTIHIDIPAYYKVNSNLSNNNKFDQGGNKKNGQQLLQIQNQKDQDITEEEKQEYNQKQQIKVQGDIDLQNILYIHDNQEKGHFQDINIYSLFLQDKINLLWNLWELVLTNKSLLLVADNPQYSSESVLGAISLISPLDFIGDYRPYFTIYDLEYKAIQDECERKMMRNIILGVTNPFFLKSLKDFPVIIRLDKDYEQELKQKQNESTKKIPYIQYNSKNQPLIHFEQDKDLMSRLIISEAPEVYAINNSLIRKHFRDLTHCFLKVFQEYFNKQTNEIKTFSENDFLEMVKDYKFSYSNLFKKKSHFIGLYQKFIRSANFINYIKSHDNIYFSKGNILI